MNLPSGPLPPIFAQAPKYRPAYGPWEPFDGEPWGVAARENDMADHAGELTVSEVAREVQSGQESA